MRSANVGRNRGQRAGKQRARSSFVSHTSNVRGVTCPVNATTSLVNRPTQFFLVGLFFTSQCSKSFSRRTIRPHSAVCLLGVRGV